MTCSLQPEKGDRVTVLLPNPEPDYPPMKVVGDVALVVADGVYIEQPGKVYGMTSPPFVPFGDVLAVVRGAELGGLAA